MIKSINFLSLFIYEINIIQLYYEAQYVRGMTKEKVTFLAKLLFIHQHNLLSVRYTWYNDLSIFDASVVIRFVKASKIAIDLPFDVFI